MIRLYAVDPASVFRHPIMSQRHLIYSYNQSEYTLLSQSPLMHDLFLNSMGPDTVGKKISLKISEDAPHEAIWIQSSQLAGILAPFEAIRKATTTMGPPPANIESVIIEFLRLCQAQGLDLISASDLNWNHGD
jgi:hypothetical protein